MCQFVCYLSDDTRNQLRHEVTNHLQHHRPVDLDRAEKQALIILKKDENIIILPADKGWTIVIMDKDNCIQKATDLLQDTNTCQQLKSDPNKGTVSCIKKNLKSLKDEQILENDTYLRIRPNDAVSARFYGLPKIHKENMPLRPIVSLLGSSTYKLFKFLANIIQSLIKSIPHSVNNGNTFLSHIQDMKIEPDDTMISFDVVSLFTSIPAAKNISKKLLSTDTWTANTKLAKDDIRNNIDLRLTPEFKF